MTDRAGAQSVGSVWAWQGLWLKLILIKKTMAPYL